jgi:predicted negative regulator of RcsB-dependent stress response
MSEVGDLKWIEAGLLLAAGVGFGWWQLRDVKRAQQASRAERETEQAQAAQGSQDKTP